MSIVYHQKKKNSIIFVLPANLKIEKK